MKKTNATELFLTVMVVLLMAAMLLAGGHLVGVVPLPHDAQAYVGGALLAFVVLGGFIVAYNCVKFMLSAKEGKKTDG